MKMIPTIVALAALALCAEASAQPASQGQMGGMHHGPPGAGSHMGMADNAFMPSMQKMRHEMMAATGSTIDASFARKMIAHHQGAIDMAKVELDRGADAQAKQIAQKTIDENTRGIQDLRDWLKQHGG